jgi:lysophospholipase L1-like esterase
MKKILCFGDSNTWGCSPYDGSRFDENTRWTMVMSSILGNNFLVFEEGFNGRTVLNLSHDNYMLNGIESIDSIIGNYSPIDIFLVCLGLNDVFIFEEVTINNILNGIEKIINIVNDFHTNNDMKIPKTVIMSPPMFNGDVEGAHFIELQLNKLKELPENYKRLSIERNCYFFNTSDYVTGSIIDGSHLDAGSHIFLGQKIAEFILNNVRCINENRSTFF